MKIFDYLEEFDVQDAAALETVLQRRFSQPSNYFNLSQSSDDYPLLSILAKGERASVHYFPVAGHPGFFLPAGEGASANGEAEPFYLAPGGGVIEIFPHMIVPFGLALQAARDFLISQALPESLAWCEL